MPVVRYRGGAPASIAEGSRAADWVANLALEGDLARLVAVETAGAMAAYFSATWNAALRMATIRPNAALDFEGFSAAGALPQVDLGLSFVFDDGTRQAGGVETLRIAVLDRDDTAPVALSFATGGTVAAGEIGAAIGGLSVSDPDTAGPFHFSFSAEDDWRFEVVNGVLDSPLTNSVWLDFVGLGWRWQVWNGAGSTASSSVGDAGDLGGDAAVAGSRVLRSPSGGACRRWVRRLR